MKPDPHRRQALQAWGATGLRGAVTGCWLRHATPGLLAALATPPVHSAADPNADLLPLLRQGGVVLAFRHALAPGTFDPPGFRLEDCRTQRNLDEEGRRQATRIGQWFRTHGLRPSAVRSSPWCRCLDTARIAFGADSVQSWAALGSPRGTQEQAYPLHQAMLRRALAEAAPRGGFEVWVTHMFVLQDLVSTGVSSAEALLLRSRAGTGLAGTAARTEPGVEVMGRWRMA